MSDFLGLRPLVKDLERSAARLTWRELNVRARREANGELAIVANLAGFDKGEIAVRVDAAQRQLVIAAEKSKVSDSIEEGATEEFLGSPSFWGRQAVSATVSIPGDVDVEKTSATYENGLLTVRFESVVNGDIIRDIPIS